MIVLPISLLVLCSVVKSWRFIIIPIVNVAIGILFSFAMMFWITHYTTMAPSFVPSVMEALVLALSIDYSLFILTRFRKQVLEEGNSAEQAVAQTLYHAGEVVFMSGIFIITHSLTH